MLGVGFVQVAQGLVADVLGLAAPAVVDGAHAGIHQGGVHRLEILGIGGRAEQEAVVGVGVAHIDLRVIRHAMHAHAVAGGAHGAGDVGTVGVVVGVERAGGAERAAIHITAGGGDRMEAVFGGFWVIGVEPRVQRADFHAFAADSGSVGFIGLHTPQAPVALVLGRTPTGRVARLAGLGVLRLRRNGQQ